MTVEIILKTYSVFPESRGYRLDMFLAKYNPRLTRSQIKILIENEQVKINGVVPKAGARLKPGDFIEFSVPPPEPLTALPEPLPLTILFEDEAVIVVNKPPELVVHPAGGHSTGTLVNGLLYHCQSLSSHSGPLRPGVVHRLDRNTSGVLVVAKDDRAHLHLAAQFKAHTITRKYLAIAVGPMVEDRGTIASPIGRHPRDRKKMSVRSRQGKEAVTHWEVLQRYRLCALLGVSLQTGRTHQIRVHLASIRHPVLGDPTYGSKKLLAELQDEEAQQLILMAKRQMLHATTLGFIHPFREEYIEFNAPPPEDFQAVLRKLEEGRARCP
jgi:23S rRNA pseudouridine1911/1915/1917 synthase